ncbi:GAF domain-containing protein [Aureisphaera galaxeae]|uniref:GAF domain-containing protein n=1 Tax=Aureisphaera galaxeae TaxID=1538023 RepID=UPI00234FF930|nr:GAF domain-containing protein [Aureisphaera galaxeae]MDC8004291.1 GAF domain-containing protein [Aureisphaera galaxeae]
MKLATASHTKQEFWKQTMTYIVGRKKVEEFLGFLVESSKILMSDTSFYDTFPKLGEIAVPYLGDWFSIDLFFGPGRVQNVTEQHMAGLDPAMNIKIGEAFRPYTQKDAGGKRSIVASKTPRIYKTTPQNTNEGPESILSNLGVRSALIVPLVLPSGCIGTMEILSLESSEERLYGPAEMALAEELGRRVSLAVERSVLYHENQRFKNEKARKISTFYKEGHNTYNHSYKI